MSDEQRRSGIGGIGDGIRTGIGILNAFREAVTETLQEVVDRGDLSPERARETVQDAAQRLQGSLGDALGRLDFAPRREVDELRAEVERLRERVARLEGPDGSGPAPAEAPRIIVTE